MHELSDVSETHSGDHDPGWEIGCDACESGPCVCDGMGLCAATDCEPRELIAHGTFARYAWGWRQGVAESDLDQVSMDHPAVRTTVSTVRLAVEGRSDVIAAAVLRLGDAVTDVEWFTLTGHRLSVPDRLTGGDS